MGRDYFDEYGRGHKSGSSMGIILAVAFLFLIIGIVGTYFVMNGGSKNALLASGKTQEVGSTLATSKPPISGGNRGDTPAESAAPPATEAPDSSSGKSVPAAAATEAPAGGKGGGTLKTREPGTAITINTDNPVIAIARDVGPCIVGISNYASPVSDKTGDVEKKDAENASGSGIIISEDGYIMTNYHVIEGSAKLTVKMSTGESLPAKLVGSDRYSDIAVLKVDKTGLPCVEMGDSDALQVGELVVAIGNPLGQELYGTVTVGYLSAQNRTIIVEGGKKMTLLQTDAAINPGNSGGALLNAKGQLIGMNTLKYSSSNPFEASVEGLGFAIPINTAEPIVRTLVEKGSISRPYLGISGRGLDPERATDNKVPQGFLVLGVEEGGPAAKAGIKENDIIIKLADQTIASFGDLTDVLHARKVGETVKVTVYRYEESKEYTFDITLGETKE